VSVSGAPEIDFNERQLRHVLRGFVDAARGADGAADVVRMFGDTQETSREEMLLLDLGRDLFEHLSAALTYFDVAPDEWASWFRRTGASRAPTTMVPAFAPTSATTWLPPLVAASRNASAVGTRVSTSRALWGRPLSRPSTSK
jgi:hypothetical protein